MMQDFAFASEQTLPSSLARPCCLIVEDQVLIGMALEAYLEDIGYEAVGPFTERSVALAWLRTHTPQAAILDYNLKDGASTELARELRRRRVPFLVYSGHRRRPDTPVEFNGVPWVEKPCPRHAIAETLKDIAPLPLEA
jgi:DNA-binding response OmpR family regulator